MYRSNQLDQVSVVAPASNRNLEIQMESMRMSCRPLSLILSILPQHSSRARYKVSPYLSASTAANYGIYVLMTPMRLFPLKISMILSLQSLYSSAVSLLNFLISHFILPIIGATPSTYFLYTMSMLFSSTSLQTSFRTSSSLANLPMSLQAARGVCGITSMSQCMTLSRSCTTRVTSLVKPPIMAGLLVSNTLLTSMIPAILMPSNLDPSCFRKCSTQKYDRFRAHTLYTQLISLTLIYSFELASISASIVATSQLILYLSGSRTHTWYSMNRMNSKWSTIFWMYTVLLVSRYLARSRYSLSIQAKVEPIFSRTYGEAGSGTSDLVVGAVGRTKGLPQLRKAEAFQQEMSGHSRLILTMIGQWGQSMASSATTDNSCVRIFLIRLLQSPKIFSSYLLSFSMTILGNSSPSQFPIHLPPASRQSCNFSTSFILTPYSSPMNFLLFAMVSLSLSLQTRNTFFLFCRYSYPQPVSLSRWQVVTRCQLLKYITQSSIHQSKKLRYRLELSRSTFRFGVSLIRIDRKIDFTLVAMVDLMPSGVSKLPSVRLLLNRYRYCWYFSLYYQRLVNFTMLSVKLLTMQVMNLVYFSAKAWRILWMASEGARSQCSRMTWPARRNSGSTSLMSYLWQLLTSMENKYGSLHWPQIAIISITLPMLLIFLTLGPMPAQPLLTRWTHVPMQALCRRICSQD